MDKPKLVGTELEIPQDWTHKTCRDMVDYYVIYTSGDSRYFLKNNAFLYFGFVVNVKFCIVIFGALGFRTRKTSKYRAKEKRKTWEIARKRKKIWKISKRRNKRKKKRTSMVF